MSKLRLLGTIFTLACIYITFNSSSGGRASVLNDDRTGAPGANGNCGSCHTGGSYGTVSLSIQMFQLGTTNAVTSYTAGTTYDMRVTVNKTQGTPGGYGFQLTCLTNTANTPITTTYTSLASNVKQKLVTVGTFNGRRYVEHNGVTNNNVFNFSWTAPTAGTGTVKFYASGNAVNYTGSDNGDNSGSTSLTITESVAVPLTVSGTVTNVSCFGTSTGAINITVSGGTSPYTYNWGGGVVSEDRINLAPGTYTVTVTDNANATATASFTVTQPTSALAVTGIANNVLCNGGSNGAINVTTTGGTSPYTYNWGGGITIEDRTNLVAGNYTVTVTDSKSCSATSFFSVTQPNALIAANTHGNISCFGGNTTITVTGNGGTAPYTGTGTFTVTSGTYNYTVTDANNCTATTSANITQPAQLTASANNITIPCTGGSGTVTVSASGGTPPYTGTGNFTETTPGIKTYTVTDANGCTTTATANVNSASGLSVNSTASPITCHGVCDGSITTTVTGGTAPYSYSWSNNASSADIGNLCAGTYTQTVSDNANCSIVNTFIVNDVPALQVSVTIVDSVTCYGNTADVSAAVTGGTSPYSYNWSNTSANNSTSLFAGTYAITVTDSNNCTVSQTGTITQPDSLSISLTNVTNDDGTGNGAIDISVTGGTAPYSFAWSNSSNTEDVSALSAGVYSVSVTDVNGCNKTLGNISIVNTGVGNILADVLQIYPNPFTSSITVNSLQRAVMFVYTLDGILLKTARVSEGVSRIETGELAKGFYILQVQGEQLNFRLRLLKSE